jgi:membrane-bound lytic murein transglycosylase
MGNFFGKIWAWIKAHPWMTGAIAVGSIIVIFLLQSSSSGGSAQNAVQSGPSDAVTAAGIQAGAEVQAAQIQANAASTQGAQQLQLGEDYLQAQQNTQIASIQAQQTTAIAADQLQLDLTNANNSAAIQALQVQTGAQFGQEAYQLATANLSRAKPITGAYSNLIDSLTSSAEHLITATPTTNGAVINGTAGSTMGGGSASGSANTVPNKGVIQPQYFNAVPSGTGVAGANTNMQVLA